MQTVPIPNEKKKEELTNPLVSGLELSRALAKLRKMLRNLDAQENKGRREEGEKCLKLVKPVLHTIYKPTHSPTSF